MRIINKKVLITMLLCLLGTFYLTQVSHAADKNQLSEKQDSYFIMTTNDELPENIDLSESQTLSYSIHNEEISTSLIKKPENSDFQFLTSEESGVELTKKKDLMIDWNEVNSNSVDLTLSQITKNGALKAINLDKDGQEVSTSTIGLLGINSFNSKMIEEVRSASTLKTDDFYNVSFGLEAKGEEIANSSTKKILAGNDANFQFELKVTGSTKVYTDAQILLELPKGSEIRQDLSELKIANVIPKYDASTGRLLYSIPVLNTGQTYRLSFGILTDNGITPKEKLIEVKGKLTANEFNPIDRKVETKVFSSLEPTISLKIKEIRDKANNLKGKDDAPVQGDIIIWELGASVPNKEAGQRYFEEGTNVVVKSFLPKELKYLTSSSNSNVTWHETEYSVFWRTPVKSNSEQAKSGEYLYNETITFSTQVKEDAPNFKLLENTARITVKDGDKQSYQEEDKTHVMVASKETNEQKPVGSIFVGLTYGSAQYGDWIDFTGTYVPTLNDTAKFRMGVSALYSTGGKSDFYIDGQMVPRAERDAVSQRLVRNDLKEINVEYTIDPNVYIDELIVPIPGMAAYSGEQNYRKYEKLPEVFVRYVVNGQVKEKLVNFSELELMQKEDPPPKEQNYRDRYNNPEYPSYMGYYVIPYEYLGLKKNDVVSSLTYGYRGAIKKETVIRVSSIRFRIKSGFTGEIINRAAANFVERNGKKVTMKSEDKSSHMKPRSVLVVPPPANSTPIVQTNVSLNKSEGNVVKEGDNVVNFSMKNDDASLEYLKGPFKSYILLTKGIEIKQASGTFPQGSYKKITDNYNGSGRQQIEITWNPSIKELNRNESLKGSFAVKVTEKTPNNINLNIYSYANNSPIVRTNNNGNGSTEVSYQQDNKDKMNPDLPANHTRVNTISRYLILRNSQVAINKQVKGNLDDKFSDMAHATPDGKIKYQLHMKNNDSLKIHRFTLIDVLPSVGDLGITDNVQRESKFRPKLSGPITLSSDMGDRFTVHYSKSKNPKRDDLMKSITYPDGATPMVNPASAEDPNWMTASQVTNWSEIGSFKIALTGSALWEPNQELLVSFDMKAPTRDELSGTKVLDKETSEAGRTAWNSFAVTINDLQSVEPKRVGVILENKVEEIIPGILPNTGGTHLRNIQLTAITLMSISMISAGIFYFYQHRKRWK
ncbi:hypothetical protein [Vagococcus carniphilus]|uniref:Uncharacterized protein n=1 Tax=Vagococcus carniphilus TaxID=218144 RepID=A0A430B6C9_9ENTE|nr:hypothetical protein [Vagococcus carniphilus]QNN72778.1 hypothetical protein H9L18_13095 [Vagococcus carniphilus]RSU15882.1 hypothetical protein CBF28_05460 [Vagococcus carniphilus]